MFLVILLTKKTKLCLVALSKEVQIVYSRANFVILIFFQPIIAQLGNVDHRAVLLLIERYATVQGNTEKNKWGRFFFFYDWIDFEVL